MRPHFLENRLKHDRRQHARVRVVARAMVAVEESDRRAIGTGNPVFCAVTERRAGKFFHASAQHAVMGDLAERDDRSEVDHLAHRRHEKRTACRDFSRQGLVLRRYATHGVADLAAGQGQVVVHSRFVGAARESISEQRGIEQIAGEIAGERTSGAIGAAHARGQPDDQQGRCGIAKRGDRGVVPGRFLRARVAAKAHEAWAKRTIAFGFRRQYRGPRAL